ncbi:MAG: DAK2 domain-containing protein [Halanaerobium sp.]
MPNRMEKEIKTIDAELFKEMVFASLYRLKEQKSFIDSLNVFPVPDGDTGTNMYLTFKEAAASVEKSKSRSISRLASALSKGALMGARGNSGVILSQLIRGLSQSLEGKSKIKSNDLAAALKKASEVAYHGVLKPVEGTILTVSRETADKAVKTAKKTDDIIELLEIIIKEAEESLERTPELLATLKEAEVVDAGAQGYLSILEGMLKGLRGEADYSSKIAERTVKRQRKIAEDIKFTYCTQMLIEVNSRNRSFDNLIKKIRHDMQSYGDSIMVVGEDDIIKIHIHTNHPGVLLEYGLKKGKVFDIKIDNMRRQNIEKIEREKSSGFDHSQFHWKKGQIDAESEIEKEEEKENSTVQTENVQTENGNEKEKNDAEEKEKNDEKIEVDKNNGIISVGNGDGIINILKELGVDYVIEGGQSMNPSTNDFVEAVEKLQSENIIILPNNKNIISAAKQVSELSDKKIAVIETFSLPQAISALMVYNDQLGPEELKEVMESEIKEVKTLEITKAIKDSKVNGLEIKEGDFIGLADGQIIVAEETEVKTIMELLKRVAGDEELVTIYYGEDVKLEEVENIEKLMEEDFNFDEIEIYPGGQPLYPYIISLE